MTTKTKNGRALYELVWMSPVDRKTALDEISTLYNPPSNYTGRIDIVDRIDNTTVATMEFWASGDQFGPAVRDLIRYKGKIATVEITEGVAVITTVLAADAIEAAESRKLTCQRCGYAWLPRTQKPAQCPNCGSTRWDTPRSGNEPGPKPKER